MDLLLVQQKSILHNTPRITLTVHTTMVKGVAAMRRLILHHRTWEQHLHMHLLRTTDKRGEGALVAAFSLVLKFLGSWSEGCLFHLIVPSTALFSKAGFLCEPAVCLSTFFESRDFLGFIAFSFASDRIGSGTEGWEVYYF